MPVAPAAPSTRVISAISAATSSGVPSALDQQHRRRVERIAGVHELLDARVAAGPSSRDRRDDARADDGGDRRARRADVGERGERHLRGLRLRQSA
jgi:hypothetical protein